MTRGWAGLGFAILLAGQVNAAEVTRLAGAGPDRSIGIELDASFDRSQQLSNITREFHEGGDVRDASELRFIGVEHRLNLGLRLGFGGSFELRYGVPVVLGRQRQWRFRGGNSAATSSLVNNCVNADGSLVDPNCPVNLANRAPMIDDTGNGEVGRTFRRGLGDMVFGLSYAVFRQEQDETRPTWVLGFNWQAPTAKRFEFGGANTPESPGNIGERVHRYELYSAFSRRIGSFDPFMKLHATIPVNGPGAFSNCEQPDPARMAAPQNCGAAGWSRELTGLRPATRTGVMFGSELTLLEDRARWQKLVIDLQAEATYVSKSRTYNEVSELFGKILSTGDYAQLGASFGIIGALARSIQLELGVSLSYLTDHLLTAEDFGRGPEAIAGPVSDPTNVNPNFDYRIDLPSRRLRVEDTAVFGVRAGVSFSY